MKIVPITLAVALAMASSLALASHHGPPPADGAKPMPGMGMGGMQLGQMGMPGMGMPGAGFGGQFGLGATAGHGATQSGFVFNRRRIGHAWRCIA